MSDEFLPLNKFEVKLVEAQHGKAAVIELLENLASAELVLPSGGAIQDDWSGFQPLLFSKNDVPMLASFSAKERIGVYTDIAPFCIVLKGRELLKRIPRGYGLVINPGQSVGFDVSPEGIAKILKDFDR